MATFSITKGFDINLAGKPVAEIREYAGSKQAILFPMEFKGVKQRLKVKEGDLVKRGTELIEDKQNEAFKLCAPAGGKIESIVRGERRFVNKIIISIDKDEQAENFRKYSCDEITSVDRDEGLALLLRTGYLAFLQQRPFGGIADVKAKPKSIFVNAMNTGPHQVSANIVAKDEPEAIQAGLNLMTRLTDGQVHLCIAPDAPEALRSAKGVQVSTFSGPHPSGNTSVHISRLDPISPHDIVWTVKAVDLVQIGRLLLDGALPTTRIVALGGPGVKTEACSHYRVRVGGSFDSWLSENLEEGEQRLLSGDALSGTALDISGGFPLLQSSMTVIPETRERRFMGWTAPGLNVLSFSSTFLSTWLGGWAQKWKLNTNLNGGPRALVLTGYYDRVMPLDIMVDFLIRAVLAGDTDEAISHGILETEPEDFALCEFICPSKTEIQQIIRNGLDAIKEEGI